MQAIAGSEIRMVGRLGWPAGLDLRVPALLFGTGGCIARPSRSGKSEAFRHVKIWLLLWGMHVRSRFAPELTLRSEIACDELPRRGNESSGTQTRRTICHSHFMGRSLPTKVQKNRGKLMVASPA